MITIVLVVLGLILGSFVSALTWRMHEGMDWVRGRSQCALCHHQLAVADLIPLFSWLFLRGRCRYCGAKISAQYPLLEAGLAISFALSYHFWPFSLSSAAEVIYFGAWLGCLIGLAALFIYDLRWMLLPNKIIYPTLALAVIGNLVFLSTSSNKMHFLVSWLASVAVSSGVFLLLYLISTGKWIGFGDVRLGLITGTLLASPSRSFLMIFLASLLGTISILPSAATGQRKFSSRVPYGPFLIMATLICMLFGASLINWYTHLVSP